MNTLEHFIRTTDVEFSVEYNDLMTGILHSSMGM